jgi:hypothetical protein
MHTAMQKKMPLPESGEQSHAAASAIYSLSAENHARKPLLAVRHRVYSLSLPGLA